MVRGDVVLTLYGDPSEYIRDIDEATLCAVPKQLMTSPYVVLRCIATEVKPAGQLMLESRLALTGPIVASPVMLTFYALRHVKSGLLMPNMKRGRGFSHWNPDNVEETQKLYSAMQTPRLLVSKKQAQRCRQLWSQYPNAATVRFENAFGEGCDEDFRTKPDGRNLDDLEIVAVHVIVNDVKET